jgi:hypothetical protein
VFQTASPSFARRLLLAGLLSLLTLCAGAGGAVGYAARCDIRDYLDRAAAWPLDPDERYLFACRYVWRSSDGGRVWTRLAAHGLPLGVRDGHIAVDRRPGYLYLGLLINSQSSVHCLQCAWTYLRPAIYVSSDGGQNWSFVYKFKRSPAGQGGFLALFVDPDHEGRAWAVIKNGDALTYYGTGTAGQFWKPSCLEYSFVGSGGCKLPANVLQFQQDQRPAGAATGE